MQNQVKVREARRKDQVAMCLTFGKKLSWKKSKRRDAIKT